MYLTLSCFRRTRFYCQWFLILCLFGRVYILFDCCALQRWCSWSKSNQNSNISLFNKVCLQWSCEIIYNFHIGYSFIWAFINAHYSPMTKSSFYSKCQPGVCYHKLYSMFLDTQQKVSFVSYTVSIQKFCVLRLKKKKKNWWNGSQYVFYYLRAPNNCTFCSKIPESGS